MARAQAFFVAGHEHWGKSGTLKAMTGGLHQVRWHSIGGRNFFIRRMSNDDWLTEWEKFLDGLVPGQSPHVILTVCPKPEALPVLQRLRSRYDLHFWAIKHAWDGQRSITSTEESALRALGVVALFAQRVDAGPRAVAFEQFVASHP